MKKVFFTGQRTIENDIETIPKLMKTIKNLLMEGATDFYAGGAIGWDMLCENVILILRDERVPYIKLHLVLPCPPEEHTARWSRLDKEEYLKILEAADSVEIVSEHYSKECLKKHNARLAETGDICVCYYDEKSRRSGAAQIVRMAKKPGKKIINLR